MAGSSRCWERMALPYSRRLITKLPSHTSSDSRNGEAFADLFELCPIVLVGLGGRPERPKIHGSGAGGEPDRDAQEYDQGAIGRTGSGWGGWLLRHRNDGLLPL